MTRFLGIGLLALVLIALAAGCDIGNQPNPVGTGPVLLVEATAVPANPTPTTAPIEPTATPPETSAAANADVLFVSATETAVGLWTFSVEVAHPDSGWESWLDEGRKLTDPAARKVVYDQVQRKLACEGPIAHLAYGNLSTAVSNKVEGFEIYSNGRLSSLLNATLGD